MMVQKIFKFLEPAPFPEPLTDQRQVHKLYKYWRLRTFYSIYLGYVVFYFTRKSFTFAMPLMSDTLGYSKADLGILGSVLYITYGISKFVSGIMSDRSNPRYFMAMGLILTGVFNILFGLSSSLLFFGLFWGLNGWFQGWGWPPCTKLLTYWFSRSERGLWWSIKSTSHNVGGALIPLVVAFISDQAGWRYSMHIPGMISILTGLWLLGRLRDIPQSLGLPSIERFKGEEEDTDGEGMSQLASPAGGPLSPVSPTQDAPNASLSAKQILLRHVLSNKAVWILALSYFFVYVVRTAVNDWGAMYLMRYKGYSMLAAASSVTWFEVGGFFGVLAAGWSSDYFFAGRRVPFMMFCALFLLLAITAFWYVPSHQILLDSILMALIGFLIFGPQLLVGLAAAEIVPKQAACTANGFAGCFAYIGAAATGYPLGKIIDLWNWHGFFVTLLICSAAIFVILFPLWVQGSPPPLAEELSATPPKESPHLEVGGSAS